MAEGIFHNLFGDKAHDYARYRPRYPQALFEFIAGCAPARGHVWDCGTGTGQAAVALADVFEAVTATDVNASQIEQAERHPKVRYLVAPAEHAPLPDKSCDAVTSANAMHWFDIPAFFAEVKRVLKPGGVVAVWCYPDLHTSEELMGAFAPFKELMEPYWPGPRQLVMDRYRTIEFPFKEIAAPEFEMHAQWTVDQFLGYLSTWSAVEYFKKANGYDAMEKLRENLLHISPERKFTVSFEMPMRVGHPLG